GPGTTRPDPGGEPRRTAAVPQPPLPSGERKGDGVALLPNVRPRATPSPALRATLSPEGRGL
ncbi:hypothetical protein GAY28_35115, partial [Azospirillum brasilense]|nr:hypothetical protein [Azospirillum brasilense]